jgi:hypothetical protein
MLFLAEIMTAQGPDPDNLPGDANPTDAPINQQLVWLAIVSLIFAYFIMTKKLKKSSSSF